MKPDCTLRRTRVKRRRRLSGFTIRLGGAAERENWPATASRALVKALFGLRTGDGREGFPSFSPEKIKRINEWGVGRRSSPASNSARSIVDVVDPGRQIIAHSNHSDAIARPANSGADPIFGDRVTTGNQAGTERANSDPNGSNPHQLPGGDVVPRVTMPETLHKHPRANRDQLGDDHIER